MDWKVSLDKYLTTDPNEAYYSYQEEVCLNFSQTFSPANDLWIYELGGCCDKWINKLYYAKKKPEDSAILIERAFRLYVEKDFKLYLAQIDRGLDALMKNENCK